MTKTPPFTLRTLSMYPPFLALPDQVRTCAIELFDLLNESGNFKRSSNMFFVFRQKRSAQLIAEHESAPGWDSSKSIPQKEISAQVKAEWSELPMEEKEEYTAQSRAAQDDLLAYFPHYAYVPVPAKWWNVLTKEGRKRFFFEGMVRICYAKVDPSYQWPGYLSIQQWAQDPNNSQYVDQKGLSALSKEKAAATSRAIRGSGSQLTLARPIRMSSHPYKGARPHQFKSIERDDYWFAKLESKLVPLGPQTPGRPERMLHLLPADYHGGSIPVYVEKEIPVGTPQDMIEIIKQSEAKIRANACVVAGYTTPELKGTTTAPLHPWPPFPRLSIPQVSPVAHPSPAGSLTPSSSVSSNNFSPTTPDQSRPIYGNRGLGAVHWNKPSMSYCIYSREFPPVATARPDPVEWCSGSALNPHLNSANAPSYMGDATLGAALGNPYQSEAASYWVNDQPTSFYANNSSQTQYTGTESWALGAQGHSEHQSTIPDQELVDAMDSFAKMTPQEYENLLACCNQMFGAPQASDTHAYGNYYTGHNA